MHISLELSDEKKKWMRYVTHGDEIINAIFKCLGLKKRYFHLAAEFPRGNRYREVPGKMS